MIEVSEKTIDGFIDENEVFYRDKAEYFQVGVLGFCGCGDLESNLNYIKKMLQMLDEQRWGDPDDTAYMFFVYWADGAGLTEHGSTVRCSWLSETGKELLSDIDTVLKDEK